MDGPPPLPPTTFETMPAVSHALAPPPAVNHATAPWYRRIQSHLYESVRYPWLDDRRFPLTHQRAHEARQDHIDLEECAHEPQLPAYSGEVLPDYSPWRIPRTRRPPILPEPAVIRSANDPPEYTVLPPVQRPASFESTCDDPQVIRGAPMLAGDGLPEPLSPTERARKLKAKRRRRQCITRILAFLVGGGLFGATIGLGIIAGNRAT